jgi:hypothetical protein
MSPRALRDVRCFVHRGRSSDSGITGAHAIMFTKDAAGVRAFLRDVLGLSSVDAGGGWPIFGLPPSELAVHPTDGEPRDELYLMADDLNATVAELQARGHVHATDHGRRLGTADCS